jgi:hypothetical protein
MEQDQTETFCLYLSKDTGVLVRLHLQSRADHSQSDAFSSPFDSSMRGTGIHATAASNILSRNWIRHAPALIEQAIWVWILGTILLALFTLSCGGALHADLSTTVVAPLAQCLSYSAGLVIPPLALVGHKIVGGQSLRMWLYHNSHVRKRRWS